MEEPCPQLAPDEALALAVERHLSNAAFRAVTWNDLQLLQLALNKFKQAKQPA